MNRRHDLAVLLLRKAAEDAAIVFLDAEIPESIFGFHAQQAAEKLLKAVLIARGVEFPRRHQLRTLMTLADEPALDRAEARRMLADLRLWAEGNIHNSALRSDL